MGRRRAASWEEFRLLRKRFLLRGGLPPLRPEPYNYTVDETKVVTPETQLVKPWEKLFPPQSQESYNEIHSEGPGEVLSETVGEADRDADPD